MKTTFWILLVLSIAGMELSTGDASASTPAGKKKVVLAYKMGAGQTFTIKGGSSSTITSDQMGQTMSVEMNTTSEGIYRVLSAAPDGTMQIEMELKSQNQTTKSPMGENSTDFSSWIGKKTQFTVSPSGTLSGFQGFDQLPEINSVTGEKISGDMVQKGMGQQFFDLPDHPVKIGETWTVKDSMDIPYAGSKLKNIDTSIYTIVGREEKDGMDCLKIELAGKRNLSGEFEQQGTQIELTRQTESKGIIYFALDRGFYISIESTSSATGQIYVSEAAITIPQTITGKSFLTVVFD